MKDRLGKAAAIYGKGLRDREKKIGKRLEEENVAIR